MFNCRHQHYVVILKGPTYPVQQRSNPPELQQFVVLQPLRELDSIILIERLETASKGDVVLLLDEQVVVGLIDDCDVETLSGGEVGFGEW